MVQKKQFFFSMSAQQYRELMGVSKPVQVQKQNKYHAQKTEVDGVKFDSKKESKDWQQLCMLEASGDISNLRRQVPFVLQEGYTNNQGKKIRPIIYNADFVYEKDGKIYVQDTKSPATRTPVYKIKKKLFEAKFKDYIFLES